MKATSVIFAIAASIVPPGLVEAQSRVKEAYTRYYLDYVCGFGKVLRIAHNWSYGRPTTYVKLDSMANANVSPWLYSQYDGETVIGVTTGQAGTLGVREYYNKKNLLDTAYKLGLRVRILAHVPVKHASASRTVAHCNNILGQRLDVQVCGPSDESVCESFPMSEIEGARKSAISEDFYE